MNDHRISFFNHDAVRKFHVSNRGEYGIFYLDGNTLLIHSSFGTYGHHWSHPGADIRRFLLKVDKDYLLSKLSPSAFFARKPVDFDKTLKRVQEEILRYRRDRELTKDDAREEWALADSLIGEHHDGYLWDWYEKTHIHDASELVIYQSYPGQLKGLYRDLWPGFRAMLQEDLKPKQYFA